MNFATWINQFDCYRKNIIVSAFSITKIDIDPDGAYYT